jgi:hypothetical protein
MYILPLIKLYAALGLRSCLSFSYRLFGRMHDPMLFPPYPCKTRYDPQYDHCITERGFKWAPAETPPDDRTCPGFASCIFNKRKKHWYVISSSGTWLRVDIANRPDTAYHISSGPMTRTEPVDAPKRVLVTNEIKAESSRAP